MVNRSKRKLTKEETKKVKLMELAGRAVIKEDKKLLQELARH